MKLHRILKQATIILTLCVFTKKNSVFWGSRFACTSLSFLSNHKSYVLQFVDFQSASLNGKRSIYLTTDHSGLNKFHGLEDENFQLVLPEIQRMVQAAQMTIEGRFKYMPPSILSNFFVFLLSKYLCSFYHDSQYELVLRLKGIPVLNIICGARRRDG